MSVLVYNGVSIRNTQLESLEQETQYDEEGGVDPSHVQIRLSVRGIIRVIDSPEESATTQTLGKWLIRNDKHLGEAYRSIQAKLTQPRRNLAYYVDDAANDLWFDIRPAVVARALSVSSETVRNYPGVMPPLEFRDIANGPRPKMFINKIIGSTMMHVTFQVTANVLLCDENAGSIDRPYVYLRFRVVDDIDEHWYVTRATTGRLRVYDRSHNPHEFRRFVLPNLLPNFTRKEMRFEESADGLTLIFSIVDQQQYSLPPAPGITWKGDHTLEVSDGVTLRSRINLSITGPPSNRFAEEGPEGEIFIGGSRELLGLVTRLIIDKAELFASFRDARILVDHFSIGYQFHANEVRASISILYTNSPDDKVLFNLIDFQNQPLGLPPLLGGISDVEQLSRQKAPRNSVSLPFTAAIQTVCAPGGPLAFQSPVDVIPQFDPSIESQTYPIPWNGNSPLAPYDSDHARKQRGVYLYYKLSSELLVNSGTIRLPLSRQLPFGVTSKSFQLHAPFVGRIIRVQGERSGSRCELPKPLSFTDAFGIEHDMITYQLESSAPKLNADGKINLMTFHDEMTIFYQLSREPAVEEIRGSTLPYDVLDLRTTTLNEFGFQFVDPGPMEGLA
jgi:hypothetical protein